jgi:hypothetical protein
MNTFGKYIGSFLVMLLVYEKTDDQGDEDVMHHGVSAWSHQANDGGGTDGLTFTLVIYIYLKKIFGGNET